MWEVTRSESSCYYALVPMNFISGRYQAAAGLVVVVKMASSGCKQNYVR
jgi:hypothetical protein